MTRDSFDVLLRALTVHMPFARQWALHERWLPQSIAPATCSLPAGLRKIITIGAWLLARAVDLMLPRRMVVVVNC